MNPPLPDKSYWDVWYIYLQSCVFALVVWYYSFSFYNDDAYISLVYARNLIEGKGLVWNAGEYVEGYSNFLFVILIALLAFAGVDMMLASKILGFAGFFGILALLHMYTRWVRPAPRPVRESVCAALCVCMALSSVPLLTWCFGGLESTLFAFFLTAGVCLCCRILSGHANAWRTAAYAGLWFALAALTRPDGTIYLLYTLGFMGVVWLTRNDRSPFTLRSIVVVSASFAALIVPYNLWRYHYFGDWMPNTYYAKAYAVDSSYIHAIGLKYLLSYLAVPPFLPLLASYMFYVVLRVRALSACSLYLSGMLALGAVYVVKVGGDWMPYGRFIVPFIPLMCLLIYHCGLEMMQAKEKLFRDLSGALLALSLLQFAIVDLDKNQTIGTISSLAVRDHVTQNWPKGSLIALNPAGYFPYMEPGYRYIDMLGLTDTTIARREVTAEMLASFNHVPHVGHMKGDGAHVLSLKPDYIIFHHMWGDVKPNFLSDAEIFAHPDFKRDYEQVTVYLDVPRALLPQIIYYEKGQVFGDDYGLDVTLDNQVRFVYFQRKPQG